MSKTLLPQVHLAQSVEEQQPSAHDVIFEFSLDKLQWGKQRNFEQPAAKNTSAEELTPRFDRQWRRAGFRMENACHDRAKFIAPTAERVRVFTGKLRKRSVRLFKVRPPLQRAPVSED